jgi:hypothetical protein
VAVRHGQRRQQKHGGKTRLAYSAISSVHKGAKSWLGVLANGSLVLGRPYKPLMRHICRLESGKNDNANSVMPSGCETNKQHKQRLG